MVFIYFPLTFINIHLGLNEMVSFRSALFFFLLLKQELGWITVGLQRTLLAEHVHGAAVHTLCTTARCRLSSYFYSSSSLCKHDHDRS